MTNIHNHQPRRVGKTVQRRINALRIGDRMQDLPEELWHDSFRYYVKEAPDRKGGPNLRIIRLEPDKPSLTVTGYIFNKFVHPFEDRFITPREAARLQGFPDELEFHGTLTSVRRQVGDAVPVALGKAVFESLLHTVQTHYVGVQELPSLSLFSGAGAMDIAAEEAGASAGPNLNTFACVEIDEDRCATLRSYFGDRVRVFQLDIAENSAEFVLKACEVDRDDVWVVYGGPPCQSFSQAGKQKGARDPRGRLIFEFLRWVAEIEPPFFVMENVSNLKGIAKGRLLHQILAEIDGLGYDVAHGLLTATYYGSPQRRRRLIFIGARRNLGVRVPLPKPTHDKPGNVFGLPPFKTVRDAFEGLPSPDYEPVDLDS